MQRCRARPDQTHHADGVADAERLVLVLGRLERDVVTEPLGLFVRVGVAAHVDEQRGVVDRSPFDLVEAEQLAEAQGDQALTKDVLHRLPEPEVDAERQRRDEFGQPNRCDLSGTSPCAERTGDARRQGRKMRRTPHDARDVEFVR